MLDPQASFCLWCGAPLLVRSVFGHERHACTTCAFVHFRSPAAAACAVVVRGREVLLIQRRIPPFVGAWALPGGFQDYGEDPASTARREVREETGLDVEIRRLLDVFYATDDPRKRVNVVAYLASPVAGTLCAADDAADARFFALDRLPDELAFENNRVIFARLRAEFPSGDIE
ncbi:MAG: NUDIX hydrolase [Planctomycetota bacterium]